MVSGKAELPERRDAFAVDVEYAAAATESVVRGTGDAGIVVTYHDGVTVEKSGAESRRKILACVHVEENGRRAEYDAIPGALSEEAADSGLPAGALQRRSEPELPLPGPQYRKTATKTLTQRELVARLKQHIPEKYFKMVRYFGFLANRVCGEKLPQVYRAPGMDKPGPVAKVCYVQMVNSSCDPAEVYPVLIQAKCYPGSGGPIKLSSMFMMLQRYKKYRHASWRTGRRSTVLPGR